MAEIFTLPNDQEDSKKPKLDSLKIYDRLDYDSKLAQLLGKEINEDSEPIGELIWPSNMVDFEANKAIIDGKELDSMIEDIVGSIQEDNDLQRIMKIRQLAGKKILIIQRIYEMLEEMGFKQIEVINEK